MHTLIAAQVAFCFLVHFAAAAFASTLNRLSTQPTGFSSERLLTLNTVTAHPQNIGLWYQVAEHLRQLPGIESVSIAGWPLLSANGSNGFVSVNGSAPGPHLAYFLGVSPGWLQTMKIPLFEGRDFRLNDRSVGLAIVNRAFVNEHFQGQYPIGRAFSRGSQKFEIIGVAADARYRDLREPITPTAYIPLPEASSGATFLVRTTGPNPLSFAPLLRHEVANARSEFRVSDVRTQSEINASQTLRERLLTMLSMFFAGVAVLLAGIGLYGVVEFSVLQRRRELGIRIAVGAPSSDIARRVAVSVVAVVLLGVFLGACAGFLLQPYVKSLLYETSRFDFGNLAIPMLTIAASVSLAVLPGMIRAIRIDPSEMLRAE